MAATQLYQRRPELSPPRTSAPSHTYARPFVVPTQTHEEGEQVQAAPNASASLLNNRYQVSAAPRYQPNWIARAQETAEPEETEEKLEETVQRSPTNAPPEAPIEPEDEPEDSPVQAKLTVGQPGDRYEEEADRVADQVMSMPDTAVQRTVEDSEEAEIQAKSIPDITRFVQRKAVGPTQADSGLEAQLNGSKGQGSALSEDVRSFMEPRFGVDFGGVRVHTDGNAVAMNKSLGAKAFAHGSDVYYGAGNGPGNDALTAHELTHTIQQTGHGQLNKSISRKLKTQKVNRSAVQAKRSTSQTAQTGINKRTVIIPTAGTPKIQAKSDPGQILEQLKNTPPTSIFSAYDQAVADSPNALEAQKQQLQKGIPALPAPTGLPAKGQQSNLQGDMGRGMGGGREITGGKESALGNGKGASAKASSAKANTVKEAPPPPPISPTHLAGSDTTQSDKSNKADAQLAQSAQGTLDSVQLNTSQISTKAGKPLALNLAGEVDPNQMDATQRESDQAVSKAKVQAAKEINRNFGENNIYPETNKEILKASKALTGKQPGAAKGDKAPTIPNELMGQLNDSLGPALKEKLGDQQQQYAVGKKKFDQDSGQAKVDADKDIAKQIQETKQKQIEEQNQAKLEVTKCKQEWQTELTKTENKYQENAKKATQDQKKKITQQKQKGEKEASQHFADAEEKAEQEKQNAAQEASQKKQSSKKKSGGFWGWVKSNASALIDGLKKAMNFIYDNLRKAVKFIFEQAKKLALAAIELARKAIVGLIKAFGGILKGLVKIAFAAFPDIAKKINAKIDKAVNTAVKVVNTAADLLKKGIAAILDFLAKTLDSLLGLIQSLYNGILTVVGMIVRGEFGELLKRLGYLVDAAKAAPPQFETAGYEELLGGNLDEPLSPAELVQAGVASGVANAGSNGQAGTPDEMPKPPWSEANIGVDGVEQNMELSPEMSAELMQQTQGEGTVELAEANDGDRTMDAVIGEATGEKVTGGKSGEDHEPKHPDDGLSPKQRAEIRWQLMKQGISKWWSDNWPKVLIGTTAAIGGFIALNVVTGGAITAALPAIMSVVGPLFVGATIAQIGGHVQGYLTQAWDGNIQGGGKSLAKGLAAGAIELVSYLTFKAGSAAIKGVKAVAKGAAKGAQALAKGAVRLAKGAANLIAKGAKFLIEKGKVLFKGIAGSALGKGFQRIKALGVKLLEKMRFKKFRIRIEKRSFLLEGYINPWIVIARGQILEVPEGTKKAVFKTDDELKALREAEKSKTGKLTEFEPVDYKTATTKGRGIKGDRLTGDHVPSRAALVAAEETKLGRKLTTAEAARIRDEGVTVVLKDTTHADLSRTYTNKNTATQIAKDAKDLGRAFGNDVEVILKGLYNDRKLTNEIVGAYLEAYKKNVARGVFSYSSDIDEMLMDFLRRIK